MSFLSVIPDAVTSAAGDLASVGSALGAANAAAAGPTTGIAAMAADEVSAAVRSIFATLAADYQAVSAQAAAFHSQFLGLLNGGVVAYLGTEIANAEQALASAASSGLTPAAGIIGGGSGILNNLAITVPLDINTPLGSLMATVTVLGDGSVIPAGTLTVPPAVALGVDALGAPLAAGNAFGNSVSAFSNAVQTGNPLGAVTALVQAPGRIAYGFIYGQGALTQAVPVPTGLGFTYITASLPFGGVLAPLEPVTLTVAPPTGSPTVVTLGGTEFGGLIPALEGLLLPAV